MKVLTFYRVSDPTDITYNLEYHIKSYAVYWLDPENKSNHTTSANFAQYQLLLRLMRNGRVQTKSLVKSMVY